MLQHAYINLERGQRKLGNDFLACDTRRDVMLRALFVGHIVHPKAAFCIGPSRWNELICD